MKALSIIAITEDENKFFPTLSLAAEFFRTSKYRILTCYFTDTDLGGVYFDLALTVSAAQESAAKKSWERSRSTSSDRRYHGKFKTKL